MHIIIHSVRTIGLLAMYLIKQEPQRIILGDGVRYKRRKGSMQLTQVNEEAYYIPLLDSLQQLLNDEFIFAEVKKVNTIIYLHHFLKCSLK